MIYHGVTIPMTWHNDAPPQWPAFDEQGRTINPGSQWIICEACGNEVIRQPYSGVNFDEKRRADDVDRAIRFHLDYCAGER